MSANDTTGASCADISYTSPTSEHTPDSSILASPDVEPPTRRRKRKRNEANWKDSKRKRALNIGEAYVNRENRHILKKIMKAVFGEKCRMRCQDRIVRITRSLYYITFGVMGTFTKGEAMCAPTWKSRAKWQVVYHQGARRV